MVARSQKEMYGKNQMVVWEKKYISTKTWGGKAKAFFSMVVEFCGGIEKSICNMMVTRHKVGLKEKEIYSKKI